MDTVLNYREAIRQAMLWLGAQNDVLFIGQTVGEPGSYIYGSLNGVPLDKRIELPVIEETQMGMTLGLALEGWTVVSIYPRVDFLLLALNQLVNHVDKIGFMSAGTMKPRILIRTTVGPKYPLNGGPQHTQRHTDALRAMLTEVRVVEVRDQRLDLIPALYADAYENGGVTLFVEEGCLY